MNYCIYPHCLFPSQSVTSNKYTLTDFGYFKVTLPVIIQLNFYICISIISRILLFSVPHINPSNELFKLLKRYRFIFCELYIGHRMRVGEIGVKQEENFKGRTSGEYI